MPMKNIAPNSFARGLWFTIGMLIAIGFTFAIYVWSEKQIDRANEVRHQSFLLVNELRQSSDDLTLMVQNYVATGNPIYKKYYQDILDIRNGQKVRPIEYQQVYWNLVMADGKLPSADSKLAIALLDLMRQAGFSEKEFRKLATAKQNSDDLTAIEFDAMKLVETTGPGAEANRTRALLMLHDEKYHQSKASIMKPIKEVYSMMDERTLRAVHASETIATILRILFIAFVFGLIFILRRTYAALKATLGGSVGEVQAQIARIGSENFTAALVVADDMQNSVLGWLAKKQANLIEMGHERRQAEQALKESEFRWKFAIEGSGDGVWDWNISTDEVQYSKRWKEMLGYAEDDILPTNQEWVTRIHPEDQQYVAETMQAYLEGKAPIYVVEYRLQCKDQRYKWILGRGMVVSHSADGKPLRMIGTHTDIDLRKAAAEEIQSLAFYDPLTHLPNRRLLVDRLNQALVSSTRTGRDGALLFLDLDHFKTLNDTIGHDTGDLLLQQVAERLTASVREGDTVARIGGDEFVVMLENLSDSALEAAAQAEVIGEKILKALSQPYQLASHEYQSTSSIGVALFSDHNQSQEELLKHADIAMYQAKKSGRNTLRFFDPHMQDAINTRVDLERELRKALEQQQFQLYYQIQVDGSTRAVGAEALIRWIHPERGLISPFDFIPLAEETGLILPIGLWVLDTACAQLKAWQQAPLTSDLTLSINVSAKQFRQADFVNQVHTAVQRHAINAKKLKLELTESMLLDNVEGTVATMNALKEIGIRFSLDDFGTGYSSLQYLKQLPLDQLKIDQSFVRDLVVDSHDRSIVRTVIAMANSLDLNVIAEGVEALEQRSLLLSKGCIDFQGYLFGRPVPIEQFEALLKQNN